MIFVINMAACNQSFYFIEKLYGGHNFCKVIFWQRIPCHFLVAICKVKLNGLAKPICLLLWPVVTTKQTVGESGVSILYLLLETSCHHFVESEMLP